LFTDGRPNDAEAPEILAQREYGTAADWWSFGAVLYELLTGLPPWYHENPSIMAKRVLSSPLQLPNYLSQDAKRLLEDLLHRDPVKRLGTRHGSLEIKSHPFFDCVDWDLVTFREIHPPIQPCQSSLSVVRYTSISVVEKRFVGRWFSLLTRIVRCSSCRRALPTSAPSSRGCRSAPSTVALAATEASSLTSTLLRRAHFTLSMTTRATSALTQGEVGQGQSGKVR
jgi:serine/threonine protein kinase